MNRSLTLLAAGCLLLVPANVPAQDQPAFRPPAVPLITHDPYFSVWSANNKLTDDWPKHWTGTVQGMCGLVRIDGRPYRWMGPAPNKVPAMNQTGLEVTPTRTIYRFEAGGARLTVTFLSPLLPQDLDLMSRPASRDWPVLACTFDLVAAADKPATQHVLLAYDDIFAIEYFYRKLRAYSHRDGLGFGELLRAAENDYASISERCRKFDDELT